MKFGESFPARRALLAKLDGQKNRNASPLLFQGKLQHLPIHGVSIDFPKYRLENGRTAIDQVEHLARNSKLPKDLFKNRESNQAQKEQHAILVKMIDEAGLRAYFKTNKQIDPLILDSDGFVVNGNRRLCAMRELCYSDKKGKKFGHFKNVDVVVLPPCSKNDILTLENNLQIQKDIRADYKWYNTAYMLKLRLEEGMEEKDVRELYELSSKQMKDLLSMFDEAERYLEAQGKPGQFSTIPDSKFAFKELVDALRKIDEAHKDEFLKLAYLVIEKAEGRRAYDQIPKIAQHLPKIATKLAPQPNAGGKTNGILKGKSSSLDLLGGKSGTHPIVLPKLNTESSKAKARSIILDTIGSEDEKEREHRKGEFAKVQLEKAESYITDAIAELESAKNKKGLVPIAGRISDLLKKLIAALPK